MRLFEASMVLSTEKTSPQNIVKTEKSDALEQI